MLELDSAAVTSGLAFKQTATPAAFTGSFALNLAGQGIFHNNPTAYQQVVVGQIKLTSGGSASGNFDVNNFGAVFKGDAINSAGTSFGTPSGSTGRGTATVELANPVANYNLSYYFIDANSAVLLGQDPNHIAIGLLNLQF
jgi:hypothetical protein